MAQTVQPTNMTSENNWVEWTAEVVQELSRAVDMQARQSRKSYQQFGITENQGAILRLLVQYGPQSSIELSKRLYVTPSNMTGIIDRLETKGLINRIRQRDRRVMDIHLTEKGYGLIQNLPDPVEVKLRWAVQKSEAQVSLPSLYAGLKLVLDNIMSQDI